MVRFTAPTAIVLASVLITAACADPETRKVELVTNGDRHLAEGRPEAAIIEYRNAIKLDEKYGAARLKLADAYSATNNPRAAITEYIRAGDLMPDDRDAQLKAASAMLFARRFEDAKARATALLERNPQDVEAMLLLANAMARLNDTKGAIDELEELLELKPDDSVAFVSLAALQAQQGDAVAAEATLRRAINLAPKSIDAKLALSQFLLTSKRYAEAEQAIKEAQALDPQHLLTNRALAMLYLVTRRPEDAEAPMRVVAERSPGVKPRLILADYYMARGRFPEAVKLLTALAGNESSMAAAESRLAQIDYREGRRDEAHRRLDAVLNKVPTDVRSLIVKAQWLTTENRLDEALEKARAAVAADPRSAPAQYTLGVVSERRRDNATAIKAFTEVLAIDPRLSDAQVYLSRLNLEAGNPEGALQHAQDAKRTEPASVAARVALVRSLLARGDVKNAETEVRVLAKALPNDATVQFLNGAQLVAAGRMADGRAALERALSIAPTHTEAFSMLVELDLQSKQLPKAHERVAAQLTRQPANPAVLVVASRVHRVSGDLEKAEQALRRAISIDPNFLPGYSMLANLYLRQSRLDSARTEFRNIVTKDPTALHARTMIGVLFEIENRLEEAQKAYEEAVAVSDRAPVAANNLAYMYAQSGTKLDDALKLAQAAKAALPDSPSVEDTLGFVYYQRNLAPLAVSSFERSIEKDPKNAVYRYHLGLAYLKLGETGKAKAALEEALKLQPAFPGAEDAKKALASIAS
jgi:tetratricopeptide (TPR) repeat protein